MAYFLQCTNKTLKYLRFKRYIFYSYHHNLHQILKGGVQ